jgi:type I restriction enzyme S subunit
VIGRYGSVGAVHWLEEAFWPHNTALYVSDFWGNMPRFVYWLLVSLSAGIAAAGSEKSAVPGLDQKDTRGIQVAVPPPCEQLAVATHLDVQTSILDALVGRGRETQAMLREYRSALITAAVTGQIDVRDYAKAAS